MRESECALLREAMGSKSLGVEFVMRLVGTVLGFRDLRGRVWWLGSRDGIRG